MRLVVYEPEEFRRMDCWPLEFAVLVVAANGTAEKRTEFTIFDHELSVEELQSLCATRLYHLVEYAILAGELKVVVGPIMKPPKEPHMTNITRNGNRGSCEVHISECGYTYIDIIDNPTVRPHEAPDFFRAATHSGTARYVNRKDYCSWARAKGFHVPADLVDERPVELERATSSAEQNSRHDVFLAYNRKDQPEVLVIAEALKRHEITTWIDVNNASPGRWFQDSIQGAIRSVGSAAMFIGLHGVGKWQVLELRAFISQCIERDIPVIPVLLAGVEDVPEELAFLRELNWVKFRQSADPDAIERLVWGIKGEAS